MSWKQKPPIRLQKNTKTSFFVIMNDSGLIQVRILNCNWRYFVSILHFIIIEIWSIAENVSIRLISVITFYSSIHTDVFLLTSKTLE